MSAGAYGTRQKHTTSGTAESAVCLQAIGQLHVVELLTNLVLYTAVTLCADAKLEGFGIGEG